MKKKLLIVVLSVFTILTVGFYSCSKNDDEVEEVVDENFISDFENSSFDNVTNCPVCNNCVLYVRCRIPSLPYGLTYYSGKKAIINAYSPVVGYAAIMPSASKSYAKYGHIAYVQSVNSDGTITIKEGSSGGTCTTRTKTPTDFKIDGYFKP